jgi:acyl-CoA dehydrogenase
VRRSIFDSDETYGDFREAVADFLQREIVPHYADWEETGLMPQEFWEKSGEMGLLCTEVPEEYGGAGGTFLHAAIVMEELHKAGLNGLAFANHSDVVAPYFVAYGTEEQKQAWLPKMVAGEALVSIAMTEPSGGSDLAALKTTARRVGDNFVVNGQKVFITNAQQAAIFVVAVKTDPEAKRGRGISLLLIERDREGLRVGQPLKKIGYKVSDTSEVFFDDVVVPVGNILGVEGQGFGQLMSQLGQERLTQAVRATAMAQTALDMTVEYAKSRAMFGKTLAEMQNTQFKLAELHSDILLNQVFVDRCMELLMSGELDAEDAAVCKLQSSEMLGRVADACLQLFGGWGYMWEYPIARLWADARMWRIAGGSVETMKHIIGRRLVS